MVPGYIERSLEGLGLTRERQHDLAFDFVHRAPVALPRIPADRFRALPISCGWNCRRQHAERKGPTGVPVDEEMWVGVESGQQHQVLWNKFATKLFAEQFRIQHVDNERAQ